MSAPRIGALLRALKITRVTEVEFLVTLYPTGKVYKVLKVRKTPIPSPPAHPTLMICLSIARAGFDGFRISPSALQHLKIRITTRGQDYDHY